MKGLLFYPLALISLSYGVVDSNKIFTQDTTLDSSYANITSTPASGQDLIWGEVKGGSKDAPITLSTTSPLNILTINNASGSVIGLEIDYLSHAKANGEIVFSSLSASDEAVGIFGRGLESFSNVGNLSFKQISSSNSYAIGFLGTTLNQQGSLSFESIDAGGGNSVGMLFYTLINQANSTITLSSVSQRSARGFFGYTLTNDGNIQIQSLTGESGVFGIEAGVTNSGSISFDSLKSQDKAIAFTGNVANLGSINVGSISAMGDGVGILGAVENQKNITFKEILSNTQSAGIVWEEDISNNGNMTFGKIGGNMTAIGIFNSQVINDGVIEFDSIVSNKMAIGLSSGIDGNGRMVFKEISAPQAVGIYGGGWFQGEGSVVFESIRGAQSCGILLENNSKFFSFLSFDTLSLHFKSIQSGVGIDNDSGILDIQGGGLKFIFGQTEPTQISATIYNDFNQGKYYLNNAKIDSPYQYAFYANQEANVYIGDSKKAEFYAKNYSFGGESNLYLETNAQVRLRTGGSLKTLQSNKALIDLDNGGYSKRLSISNFQAQDSNFVMSVDLDWNQTSGYDGGAVYEENVATKKGVSAFLQIDSSKTTSQVNNTLAIDLESKTNTTQKYIVLAQVSGANKDNIIFNSLSDGQTIAITPSAGYQASGLLLGRYDDSVTQSNYYYLIANPFEVQDPIVPTPTPTPTPQEPSVSKEGRNTLFYSPSQSILLSTFDWGKTRFAKLRSDNRTSRIWAELGAGYWTYNSLQPCNEAFVDFLIGGDYLFSFAKGRNALGLAVEVTGGFIEQTQTLGDTENVFDINSTYLSISLYNVLMLDNGVYSHTVFRVGGGGSEFAKESSFVGESSSQEGMIYAFSEKVGKRFYFSSNQGVFTDLSAMVAIGYVENSSFSQTNQSIPWEIEQFAQISSPAGFLNQNKIEVYLGYQSAFNSSFSFDVSAGVGFVSNHCIGGGMSYETQNGIWEFENTPYVGSLEVGANLVVRMGDWIDTFVNISSAWSKQYNEVVDFSAGIKLRFGTV